VCPYHSWSFASDGSGRSPGNPSFRPQIRAFDTVERFGYCWIRERKTDGDDVEFPAVEFSGYDLVHSFELPVAAPFNLLMDNMAELEHTASVHQKFGFALPDLSKVITRASVSNDKELDIYYEGPQREVPWYLSVFAGLRGGDNFVQYATVRFGPVHATYELTWIPSGGSRKRPFSLRFVIFYNPVDETNCRQFAFVFLSKEFSRWLRPFVVPILVRVVEREIRADVKLVETLTADAVDPARHLLGRFDQPLISARRLIQTEYVGFGDH
jgi:phenylpropionate dioxygenase-like ring-hydroxylating dioxygenase large terminal subunit